MIILRFRFGTRGSQVRILSPRPFEGRELFGESQRLAAFAFWDLGVLGHRWDMARKFWRRKRAEVSLRRRGQFEAAAWSEPEYCLGEWHLLAALPRAYSSARMLRSVIECLLAPAIVLPCY